MTKDAQTTMIAVKQQPFSTVDTYGLRNVFKLNGFRYFFRHKLWAIEIEKQATAVKLLSDMNISDHLDLVEMPLEELCCRPKQTIETLSKGSVMAKTLTELGVDMRKINRLIDQGKIALKNFQVDSLGRKINKRISIQDAKREFPELADDISS